MKKRCPFCEDYLKTLAAQREIIVNDRAIHAQTVKELADAKAAIRRAEEDAHGELAGIVWEALDLWHRQAFPSDRELAIRTLEEVVGYARP